MNTDTGGKEELVIEHKMCLPLILWQCGNIRSNLTWLLSYKLASLHFLIEENGVRILLIQCSHHELAVNVESLNKAHGMGNNWIFKKRIKNKKMNFLNFEII